MRRHPDPEFTNKVWFSCVCGKPALWGENFCAEHLAVYGRDRSTWPPEVRSATTDVLRKYFKTEARAPETDADEYSLDELLYGEDKPDEQSLWTGADSDEGWTPETFPT
jgi:hypothetical protein